MLARRLRVSRYTPAQGSCCQAFRLRLSERCYQAPSREVFR